MERMAENGTAMFANPDDYQAGIGDAHVSLISPAVETSRHADLAEPARFPLLCGCENLPRIAFISLLPAQVFVSFPANAGAPLTYDGFGLKFGDVVFHSRGDECISGPVEKANGPHILPPSSSPPAARL